MAGVGVDRSRAVTLEPTHISKVETRTLDTNDRSQILILFLFKFLLRKWEKQTEFVAVSKWTTSQKSSYPHCFRTTFQHTNI